MLPQHRLFDLARRWINDNWFKSHRLKIAGLIVPILVVSAIEVIYLPTIGSRYTSRVFVLILVGSSIAAVTAFGLLMFRLIDRAQAQIVSRNTQLAALVAELDWSNKQGAAYQRILHAISSQLPFEEILEQILHETRNLVKSDSAYFCLNSHAPYAGHEQVCPSLDRNDSTRSLVVPLSEGTGSFGEMFVTRINAGFFSPKETQLLEGLSQLALIAIKRVQAREFEHQSAILTERERIAREMHDSLAQAVGATHLRLRALENLDSVKTLKAVRSEIRALGDICEDAYGDVREAILGLRTSTKSEGSLRESLEEYLRKYSQQCGIETKLIDGLNRKLLLSPKFEVQILRVVQEALTNVRKHSGAKEVKLVISENGLATTFSIEDNGKGFNPEALSTNRQKYGLDIMRERIEMLAGTLVVDSRQGRGTRVVASIPEISPLNVEPEAVSIG